MEYATIISTGSYIPRRKLTNDDLAPRLQVEPAWIERRTGIRERGEAAWREATSDLAVAAARKALRQADLEPGALDAILLATSTPDQPMPASACRVQQRLGCGPIPACDLSASCLGFLYGLQLARGQIQAGLAERVLVVGSEVRTRFLHYDDRDTAVLYGDGAGAVILAREAPATDGPATETATTETATTETAMTETPAVTTAVTDRAKSDTPSVATSSTAPSAGDPRAAQPVRERAAPPAREAPARPMRIEDVLLGAAGGHAEDLCIPGGGSRTPAGVRTVEAHLHTIRMKGRRVFRAAARKIPEVIDGLLARNGLARGDLDLVVPHQMNRRLIETVARRMDLPIERFFINVEHTGNTSAASIPIALDEALRSGRSRPGMRICLAAFGGGYTWGAALLRSHAE